MNIEEAYSKVCNASNGDVIVTTTIGRVLNETVETSRVSWWKDGNGYTAIEDTLETAVAKALEALKV